jgi:DNA-directed RNA polymerase subunit K/omega
MATNIDILSYNDINDKYDPSKNRTLNRITIYEKTAVIGMRRQQLANGANHYISDKEIADANITNKADIADLEYKLNKLPFIVVRTLPDESKEYWKLQDLKD